MRRVASLSNPSLLSSNNNTPSSSLTATSSSLQSHLQACKTVHHLHPILSRFIISGLVRQPNSLFKLINFLLLSPHPPFLLHARLLLRFHFDAIPASSTFLYNTLIRSYTRTRFPEEALTSFLQMLRNGLKPDNYTFPFLIKASTLMNSMGEGKQAHAQIVRTGFQSDVFVLNTLLNMYSVFRDMEAARALFDAGPCLDVVSWNTMIDGYVKSGAVEIARQLFNEMPVRNEVSWSAMIAGYASNGDLDVAQSLFNRMPVGRNIVTCNSMISGFARCGFLPLARKLFDEMPERNVISWNSMIVGYTQSGDLESARRLFDEMPDKDVVSWSCMISAYVQSNRYRDALEVFREMQIDNRVQPNEVTMVSMLSVCARLAALDQGKWIHAYIDRKGMRLTDNLGAALIDMYAKCGSIETAIKLFWKLDRRNVSTWNALITGLAINGFAHESLEAFAEMQRLGMKPNDITFMGVLTACCHGGLVDEGRHQFGRMLKDYEIRPEMKHYGCIVDLLGRAGLLEEAEEMVKSMPMKPDVMILGALLGACRIHGDVGVADRVRRDFLELRSRQAGCHVLLSNIYAAADRWADASEMRNIIRTNDIRKEPGSSSIELDGSVYEFLEISEKQRKLLKICMDAGWMGKLSESRRLGLHGVEGN
ncbi:pentatricopeptide repeat-containing protein At1g08070, chloroplastic-like [Magnolia sinica]|uniref:pentatricopeptide repeat-containing protein At1g08070, chloroplastic-like n=1 Tax=Magnolia sinica TaxID=86752 RepID=UPI002658EFE2|nr:pentatricopeptide repeat-containing protein At1g08070, chloroplastic-like [Magnolia sinica]